MVDNYKTIGIMLYELYEPLLFFCSEFSADVPCCVHSHLLLLLYFAVCSKAQLFQPKMTKLF